MTTITLDKTDVERIIGAPFETTAHQCHAVSLKIVKSGLLPGARVARGVCQGVPGQHSWIVVGPDCYAPDAVIVDPTLWAHVDDVDGVWHGTAAHGWHTPHGGRGDIWSYGRPADPTGPIVALTPKKRLSWDACLFLNILGPLDRQGWAVLASSPVAGWPAAEIVAAIADTPELAALVPIDRLGMLTDRNPDGLYLPTTKN